MNIPELRSGLCYRWYRILRLPRKNLRNGRGFSEIIHIQKDGLMDDIPHRDILHKNFLHDAPPPPDRFESQPDVRTDKGTIGDKDIPCAPRHLAPHHKSTVSPVHDVLPDDHIFSRPPSPAPILIAARFHADPVIPGVECAVLYQDIPA